jgi:hypothetical protein
MSRAAINDLKSKTLEHHRRQLQAAPRSALLWDYQLFAWQIWDEGSLSSFFANAPRFRTQRF